MRDRNETTPEAASASLGGTMNYILEGDQPVATDDILEWARWFEQADRVVAKDEIGKIRISTVFLGIDHNFGNSGPSVLWETMIFGGEHDEYQERYTSRIDAENGHLRVVQLVKSASEVEGE